MMNKETFVRCVEAAENVVRFQEGMNDYFRDNGADGYLYYPDCSEQMLILLEEVMELEPTAKDGNTWLSYFCYDLDFGKGWKTGMVTVGGEDVDLSDAGKLWDFLAKEKENE